MSDMGSEHPVPARAEVSAVVKWFNPAKGFGFVKPADGSPDAFLHVSVLEQSGHRDIPEAATIVCDIGDGPKGPQVVAIRSVEAPEPGEHSAVGFEDIGPAVEGTVKFFDIAKGFGFIVPDNGERDVFISGRVLAQSGLRVLQSEQRVRYTARQGDKGPTAESIEVV